MQALVINMVVALLQRLIDKGVWSALRAAIETADALGVGGAGKRTWVLNQLSVVPEPARSLAKGTASYLINLALEALVAKLKSGAKAA